MPRATVADIEIYYERAGDGPPLLFIGGSGGDLRHAPGVFDGPLPHRFEVLAYDQRGLGRTTKPGRDYTMQEYGDDAAGLLEAVGWRRARVMGVSFGGMVAQELAIRHPDRVERLVLACTSSGGRGGASYPLHDLADLEPDERIRRHIGLSDVANDENWQRENPDAVRALVDFARARQPPVDDAAALAGARRQLEARRHHDTWERLSRIRCPTLVCGGRRDGIAPPPNQEALVGRIAGAELAMFDGGHLFLMQDRAAFPRIIDFLLAS